MGRYFTSVYSFGGLFLGIKSNFITSLNNNKKKIYALCPLFDKAGELCQCHAHGQVESKLTYINDFSKTSIDSLISWE